MFRQFFLLVFYVSDRLIVEQEMVNGKFLDRKFTSNRLKNPFFFYLAYSFEGIIIFVLLTICTCGYMRRVPKLREWFFSEKKGFAGIFYKGVFSCCFVFPMTDFRFIVLASIIGTRLSLFVAISCIIMAFWLAFLR